MRGTADKIRRTAAYGKWLKERLEELKLSQAELAEQVKKSQKTISRYVNGETYPDAETEKKIEEVLQKYEAYKPIPSEKFSKIMQKYMTQFRQMITQRELAAWIGKSQEEISRYMSGMTDCSYQLQRSILSAIYEMSGNFGMEDCADEEYRMARAELWGLMCELNWTSCEDLFPPYAFAKYLMTLPIPILDVVLENMEAFLDNYQLQDEWEFSVPIDCEKSHFDSVYENSNYLFDRIQQIIEYSKGMSSMAREEIRYKLNSVYDFSRSCESHPPRFFYIALKYYAVCAKMENVEYTLSDMNSMREYQEGLYWNSQNPTDPKIREDYEKRIVNRLYGRFATLREYINEPIPTDSMDEETLATFHRAAEPQLFFGREDLAIREVSYKLDMDLREWQLWLNCLIYCFDDGEDGNKSTDIDDIFETMKATWEFHKEHSWGEIIY